MAAVRRIPTVLGARRGTTLDQAREQFERSQEMSYRKAVNDEESPVKMKHIRNLIIGTFTDKNSEIFWRNTVYIPPNTSDIVAWKFCHSFHILLRDGHVAVLRDSFRHLSRITDLGDHFKHLQQGYGSLITKYCNVLVRKLNFHHRNQRFPGSLIVTPEELLNIAENDANNLFDMAAEMLDYMESILVLNEAVFGSMNPSRSNSMTKSGQCRLAPLIPCIQDSSCLYDSIVRILFQLHKAVSVDFLTGHRCRFNEQFKQLQLFYNNSRNLQYFRGLIQVPTLPTSPPNFLIEAELKSHVAPVVVVSEQPHDYSTSEQSFDATFVDTDSGPPPIPPPPNVNGCLEQWVMERDGIIETQAREIDYLRELLQRVQSEASYNQESFRRRLAEAEAAGAAAESELLAEQESKASILAQVEAAAAGAEAVPLLALEETRRKASEEKFAKLKDMYQKLREEHLVLLRGKADFDKKLQGEQHSVATERKQREQMEQRIKTLESQLEEKNMQLLRGVEMSECERTELSKTREDLQLQLDRGNKVELIVTAQSEELSRQQNKIDALQRELESVASQLSCVAIDKSEWDNERKSSESLLAQLRNQLSEMSTESTQKISSLTQQLKDNLNSQLNSCIDASLSNVTTARMHMNLEIFCESKSTTDFTLVNQPMVEDTMASLLACYGTFFVNKSSGIGQLSHDLCKSSHIIATFMLHAKATSHALTDLDKAEKLVSCIESVSDEFCRLLQRIRTNDSVEVEGKQFLELFSSCCNMLVMSDDKSARDVADMSLLLQKEMQGMEEAIKEAGARFQAMLEATRAKDTGTKLEVNEVILATCGELMSAVRLLVVRASELQKEIVAGVKGAPPREFYKRNHRWTEGLISGAKAVAIACQALMSAADQVVTGGGKFEEVIVASREIAASSIQLVMSSRVKANQASQCLANLNAAAKTISSLTGTVVATAENCRDKITTANTLDFSKLSLHSAKRLEMETLVKVLETEKKLELERVRLAALRRHHYQLAGELEGWDEEDMKK